MNTPSEPAPAVAGSAGSAGSGSPETARMHAPSDALEVVRGVMSDPQASPATKLAAARAVLEEQDRREGRRRAIRWAEIDVAADTEGADSDVLRGLALQLWQVVDERERLSEDQREACALSSCAHDLGRAGAEAFMSEIDSRTLRPEQVERLLRASLREALALVQGEIDSVANGCALYPKVIDCVATEPAGDA